MAFAIIIYDLGKYHICPKQASYITNDNTIAVAC